MQEQTKDLKPEVVMERVKHVQDDKVIDELHTFGTALLSEIREVRSRIESKCLRLLTWSIAIVGFAFTQIHNLQSDQVALRSIFLIATITAGGAIICAYWAVISKKRAVPSDEDWFQVDSLDSAVDLKLYHVRAMHRMKYDLAVTSAQKGTLLQWSETLFVSAGILLICSVLVNLYLAWNR